MLKLLFQRKKKNTVNTGIKINENSERNQSENRVFTLFAKALIVFFVVGGAFGAFLSAVSVNCNLFLIELVLLAVSLFTAFLYYNAISENVGYIFLLFVMAACGSSFMQYINSGFYTILNKLNEKTAVYFDSNAVRVYTVMNGDNPAYVTMAMIYIGAVCCILTNIFISRRMRIWPCVAAVIFAMFMPLYIGLEPSGIFVVMLLTGFLLAVMIKKGGHYRLHRQDNKYEYKKERYTYIYSAKTLFETWALVLVPTIVVTALIAAIFPGNSIHKGTKDSEIKTSSNDVVQNLAIYGLAGLFNYYENSGGLSSGRLGGISSVRLDYETDLTLVYTPLSENRIYLRHFTGGPYEPFFNRWTVDKFLSNETAISVKGFVESGGEYSGTGKMSVRNVAAEGGGYLPYFCPDDPVYQLAGSTTEYTYYTSFAAPTKIAESRYALREKNDLTEEEKAVCLLVPEDNTAALDAIIKDAGLDPALSPPQNAMLLASYYQANIPYTYRPGYTPRNKDFVNYFLMENRRGYCSHFASAATLVFRRLGIPARYVEGYVVDATDVVEEGKIREDLNTDDYYSGYKMLADTAVVEVNVSDSGAHAWVEMWIEGIGWQIVDITPASAEQPDANMWRMFLNFFNGTGAQSTIAEADDAATEAAEPGMASRAFVLMFEIILVAAFVCFAVYMIYKYGGRYVMESRARSKSVNDRVIHRYGRYIRKLSKNIEELSGCINYREQLDVLSKNGYQDPEEAEHIAEILERAGFSNEDISGADEKLILSMIKNTKKVK
ncbi:MAG: transglutaminase-like domain-containing protein [Lachnospiraceae bacterium]|nr:transglutaminase-like domain-containing protein [Lachnospiraceae bacterium]